MDLPGLPVSLRAGKEGEALMPRYRSTLTERELNYSDSGGPVVAPGAEFEHAIPPAQLASHLRSGFIVPVNSAAAAAIVDEVHEHQDRAVVDTLKAAGAKRFGSRARPSTT
jgi:hypothetical protein